MTDSTLVKVTPATQVYKNPIAVRFFDCLDLAVEDFKQNGKLTFPTIEKILGKPPVIPDSPDMDARMEAYEELSKYSNQVLNIECKLRTYVEKKRAQCSFFLNFIPIFSKISFFFL